MALLQGLMSKDGKRPENHQNEETFRNTSGKAVASDETRSRLSHPVKQTPMSTHVP